MIIGKKDTELLGRPEGPVAGYYPDGRPLISCCIHLRCKSMYYTGVEKPGLLHDSGQMTYWCNLTQESMGCDGGDCTPGHCQPGRSCCETA
jgi:hypothetical protein